MQEKQFGLSLAALNTLAKLSTAHQAALIRGSQHIDKTAVLEFGRSTAAILVELVDGLPRLSEQEKNTFVDTFLLRFAEALTAAHNGERKTTQPLLLEYTK